MVGADALRADRSKLQPGLPDRRSRGHARTHGSANIGNIRLERGLMDFISILSIFVLACFVGYYVVWSVTPALHTPLMSVTNAISSVIVVGALIAAAAAGSPTSKWLGLIAVALASVNIFGGFAVTARMLAMYKKKERKDG
jgi:NAD(P) transhydrogenase subunit alpha